MLSKPIPDHAKELLARKISALKPSQFSVVATSMPMLSLLKNEISALFTIPPLMEFASLEYITDDVGYFLLTVALPTTDLANHFETTLSASCFVSYVDHLTEIDHKSDGWLKASLLLKYNEHLPLASESHPSPDLESDNKFKMKLLLKAKRNYARYKRERERISHLFDSAIDCADIFTLYVEQLKRLPEKHPSLTSDFADLVCEVAPQLLKQNDTHQFFDNFLISNAADIVRDRLTESVSEHQDLLTTLIKPLCALTMKGNPNPFFRATPDSLSLKAKHALDSIVTSESNWNAICDELGVTANNPFDPDFNGQDRLHYLSQFVGDGLINANSAIHLRTLDDIATRMLSTPPQETLEALTAFYSALNQ